MAEVIQERDELKEKLMRERQEHTETLSCLEDLQNVSQQVLQSLSAEDKGPPVRSTETTAASKNSTDRKINQPPKTDKGSIPFMHLLKSFIMVDMERLLYLNVPPESVLAGVVLNELTKRKRYTADETRLFRYMTERCREDWKFKKPAPIFAERMIQWPLFQSEYERYARILTYKNAISGGGFYRRHYSSLSSKYWERQRCGGF